jgi:peptide/nickel transport system substrate-binding protein
MRSRRRWRALTRSLTVLSLTAAAAVAVPVSFSGAIQTSNENANTLVVSLPGPFNGCTFLDPGATPTSDAVLDLIRPSAFVTSFNGTLIGQDGPIASAELTSLQPETVRYTVAAKLTWSDGATFTGEDLVAWWHEAKTLSSVVSDGYRAIKSLSVSTNGLAVTAVFAHPYADWELLFRDVEASGTAPGCAISNLVTRPSLGPYVVQSATSDRLVLVMNHEWPLDTNRFGRVVINDTANISKTTPAAYASYSLSVNRAALLALSNEPTLQSHIGSSADIEEMTFAPRTLLTTVLGVREALSWSVQRQSIIDQLFGQVTFSPSVAASAIYSQGQSQYPGSSGSGPIGQSSTTTTVPTTLGLSDCVSCAIEALMTNGFTRSAAGWTSAAGQKLVVRLGVGPSALDQSVAPLVEAAWKSIGIPTTVVSETSETAAAMAAASSTVDVALFTRLTTTTPSYTARSWAGAAYPNTYPSGVRVPTVTALFTQASGIFNAVTAAATWLKLDQVIMTDFWVRPLFTDPSLIVWSSSLEAVNGSFTIPGFVDQVPLWTLVAPVSGS